MSDIAQAELIQNDILDKLHNTGIKIFSADFQDDNSDGDNNTENNKIELKIYPHYNNNFGFFEVITGDIKFIILKGQYSDNVRNIKGKPALNHHEISSLIDILFLAERTINAPISMDLILIDGTFYVQNVYSVEKSNQQGYIDLRDYTIPRPLADSEYKEKISRLYDEDVILSSGYFSSFLPNVSSYFTSSIFDELADILNPIFISCNLKTSSPTAVNICGKVYINMTYFEKMMHSIGLNKSLYRRVYAPNLFLKMGISKLDKLNRSFFPVQFDEISELLDDLKATINKIDNNTFLKKSFYDYIVKIIIIYEYISIEFINSLSYLLKKFNNISDILNIIYKTRKSSIFYKQEEMVLPDYLDFASNYEPVTFNINKKDENIKKYLKGLPLFSNKSKIKKAINYIHKILDLRDELYLLSSNFIINTNKLLIKNGERGCSLNKLNNPQDIVHLDHDEIRRLSANSLFGNISELVAFRKWRQERYKAQIMPPEIYGYDLANIPNITENMILKYQSEKIFRIYPLNSKNISGDIENNLDLDNYENKIIAGYNLPMTKFNNYLSAKGIILENVTPLSFITEFAILNDIPLYTGVRFAGLFLEKVKITGDKLYKEDE